MGQYHEYFTKYTQANLLKKHFQPSEEQLIYAKQSLVQRHKALGGIQQLLFCSKSSQKEQFMTTNDKQLIQTEKKKYTEYLKNVCHHKFGEQLLSLNKLKALINERNMKLAKEQKQKIDQKYEAEEIKNNKRIRLLAAKAAPGKKKVKTQIEKQQKPKAKATKSKVQAKKQQQKISEKMEQEQIMDEDDQSLGLDLLDPIEPDESYRQDF